MAKVKLLKQVELLVAELSAAAGDSETLKKPRSVMLAANLEQLQSMVTLGRAELARAKRLPPPLRAAKQFLRAIPPSGDVASSIVEEVREPQQWTGRPPRWWCASP